MLRNEPVPRAVPWNASAQFGVPALFSPEDMEDLIELRAAVERNAGKAGTPWEQVKAELDLD